MKKELLVKTQEKNMFNFASAFTEIRYKQAESTIENYSLNTETIKVLALDIFHETTKSTAKDDTNKVLDIVEAWSMEIEQSEWKSKVIEFCEQNDDIYKALIGIKADAQELIMIMDDSTKDIVLDYNEFCFEIMKETKAITDFMVLDTKTSKGIEYMYNDINVLYKRG